MLPSSITLPWLCLIRVSALTISHSQTLDRAITHGMLVAGLGRKYSAPENRPVR